MGGSLDNRSLGKGSQELYFSKASNEIVTNRFKTLRRSKYYYIAIILVSHTFGYIGILQLLEGRVMIPTVIFAIVLGEASFIGSMAGAHRLWTHRCYSASIPLKLYLAAMHTICGHDSLWWWCVVHRVHHKFADTDADPHNARRGFIYSHLGWLLTMDYKVLHENIRKINVSDLEDDPIVMFTEKNVVILQILCPFVIPAVIPWYFFGESFYTAFCVAGCLRFVYTLHAVSFVNSAAHLWGSKPYDTTIQAAENMFATLVTCGEGWHNYHHVFPWDYKASELGSRLNFTTYFIEFFAWIKWAYDLKTVSRETVLKRVKRTGVKEPHRNKSWGWGDKDTAEETLQDFNMGLPSHTKFTN